MVFGEVSHAIPEARGYGWDIQEAQFDWDMFHGKLDVELTGLKMFIAGF